MTTDVDFSEKAAKDIWYQDEGHMVKGKNKWKGSFGVEWLYG